MSEHNTYLAEEESQMGVVLMRHSCTVKTQKTTANISSLDLSLHLSNFQLFCMKISMIQREKEKEKEKEREREKKKKGGWGEEGTWWKNGDKKRKMI